MKKQAQEPGAFGRVPDNQNDDANADSLARGDVSDKKQSAGRGCASEDNKQGTDPGPAPENWRGKNEEGGVGKKSD